MHEVAVAAFTAAVHKPCGFQVHDQLSYFSRHQKISCQGCIEFERNWETPAILTAVADRINLLRQFRCDNSGARGRAFLHGLPVRRAERVASESCPCRGTLALGPSASLETAHRKGEVVVGGLAVAVSGGLDRARQRTANGGGVGGAAWLRATRQTVRRGRLVRPDRPPPGPGKHASPSRPPQRA